MHLNTRSLNRKSMLYYLIDKKSTIVIIKRERLKHLPQLMNFGAVSMSHSFPAWTFCVRRFICPSPSLVKRTAMLTVNPSVAFLEKEEVGTILIVCELSLINLIN